MVGDGFQTQKRGSWIPGKERAERVLASAISIDGRKEWTCKFSSESNVWTRWRCRCCYNYLPTGLRGKYRQAIAARVGEWSTGSSTSCGEEERRNKSFEAENEELRARLEALEKEGKRRSPRRARASIKERERSGRRVGCGDGPRQSRKKLDEHMKKLQKELRDIEKFSCIPKEFQDSLESNLQQQLQEVEQRRHDLMPEHQKVQKRSQNTKTSWTKEEICSETVPQEKRMRMLQGKLKQMEDRVLFLSNKIDKNKMAADLRSLQAGEERGGSNASQTGDGCLEALWQQYIALGANGIETFVQRLQREMRAAHARKRRRKKKQRRLTRAG